MERLVEGNDRQQRKLDQGPRNLHWWTTKAAKHTLWLFFAFWTGITFVGYFTPIRDLIARMWSFQWGSWETFWVFFYGFATYGNAGFLREQICFYMCPYARFQSVMFDRDTMIVTYDRKRGEPRGRRRRDDRPAWLGDCVDCHKCVQVCPTGIDIRYGLQYQCIGCGSCVDACDDVMKKLGYPTGLVRFSSQRAVDEGGRTRIIRPRVVFYGTLLAIVLGIGLYSVLFRTPLRLEAIRDRNVLYREVAGGHIENVFTLKVANMDAKPHRFVITVAGLPDAKLGTHEVYVATGAVETVPVRLSVDARRMDPGSAPFWWYIEAQDDPALKARRESRFLIPAPQP
jgi:cytochrome c oxidase accessory protein FixG